MSSEEPIEVQGRAGEPIPLPVGSTAATGSHMLVSAPAGRYDLVARLARPWEPEPVRVVRITLIVS